MINKVLNEPVYDDDAVNKKYVDECLKDISVFYPIGSIYMNVSPVDPNEIFSFGVWERIEDVFLLSAGSTYEAGSTGGEAEHILTVEEMAPHYHNVWELPMVDVYGGGVVARGYKIPPMTLTEAPTTITGTVGRGKPHNNMPPYLTVYMWKRIA